MIWVELIGYLGSALVAASLTQSRILWLRVLSLSGAVVFTVYGVLIESIPIVLTNLILLGINVWHLWRITSRTEEFSLLEVSTDSAYLRRFLDFHADDIAAAQPDFSGVREGDTVVLVLRDMVPTVAVVGRQRDDEFRVFLDYAIPSYRDFKSGKWLYDNRPDFFHRMGVKRIVATARSRMQTRYLERAGFQQRPDGKWERPVG
ncbi:MAG: hypothetical protein ACLFWM_10190 [Actinomycetota bacterium]